MSLPEPHDFSVEVRAAGEGRIVYMITGAVTCPQLGWMAWLVPGNEGIWDDPERAVLELRLEHPDIAPPVVTEVPVMYAGNDDARLATVEIRLPDGVTTRDGADKIILEVAKEQATAGG